MGVILISSKGGGGGGREMRCPRVNTLLQNYLVKTVSGRSTSLPQVLRLVSAINDSLYHEKMALVVLGLDGGTYIRGGYLYYVYSLG